MSMIWNLIYIKVYDLVSHLYECLWFVISFIWKSMIGYLIYINVYDLVSHLYECLWFGISFILMSMIWNLIFMNVYDLKQFFYQNKMTKATKGERARPRTTKKREQGKKTVKKNSLLIIIFHRTCLFIPTLTTAYVHGQGIEL
jgi:hypothetical protein